MKAEFNVDYFELMLSLINSSIKEDDVLFNSLLDEYCNYLIDNNCMSCCLHLKGRDIGISFDLHPSSPEMLKRLWIKQCIKNVLSDEQRKRYHRGK